MSSPSTNRRSFLARGAVLAAVPAIATLAGGVLAEPASADDTLPDYAPVPPSALGPALNAQGYFVGRSRSRFSITWSRLAFRSASGLDTTERPVAIAG